MTMDLGPHRVGEAGRGVNLVWMVVDLVLGELLCLEVYTL